VSPLWSELRSLLGNRSLRRWWLLLAALVVVLHLFIEQRVIEQRDLTRDALLNDRLSVVRYQLESALTNNLSLINGLAAFISSDPDFPPEQYETYARTVLAREPALVNLAAAPDMVVEYVYPLSGNEQVLGLDYLQTPEQREQALQVVEQGMMIIAGPVNLVQGGVAFIGRAPVYIADESGQEQFWGIVSAPILVDSIYNQAGLTEAIEGMEIAVRSVNGESNPPAFFGQDALFDSADVLTMPITAGGSEWQIAAIPTTPLMTAWEIWLFRLASLIVLLLASLLLLLRSRNIIQNDNLRKIIFRNERFLRAVETVSRVGGWRWSGHHFTELSARTRKIMDLPDDGSTVNMAMFCHTLDSDGRQLVEECLQHALTYQHRLDEELELRRRNGELIWLHIKAEPVFIGEGEQELLGALQDITKAKELDQLIEFQANYDVLTHLPNRALFLDRLQTALLQAQRRSTRVALLFIDLDNFKSVNDNLGHDAGDELLVQAAQRIQNCVREADTVARHSGDEFVVLLADVFSNTVVARVADKIVSAMRVPFVIDERQIYCSVSIGAALYPDDGDQVDTLVIKADQAMYEVKKSGRNAWQFYTEAMQQESEQKHRLYNELVAAMESEQLKVFYQPVIDAVSGAVISCEALVRWPRENVDWVAPDMFIPLAEERGLINRIDLYVLRQALSFVGDLNSKLSTDVALSVNVSPKLLHMRDDDAHEWLRLLRRSHPCRLTIEITERVLLDGSESVLEALQSIDEAGVGVAIDDFGTGYSGLSYFSRFPVSVVKIDRSFVQSLPQASTQTTLVETILLMADKLGIAVVAEGVETKEQAAFLRNNQCNFLQGYHIAPPLSAEAFSEFVRQNRTSAAETH
jgi:diguanylate cyclase (GGDEF)-like protein